MEKWKEKKYTHVGPESLHAGGVVVLIPVPTCHGVGFPAQVFDFPLGRVPVGADQVEVVVEVELPVPAVVGRLAGVVCKPARVAFGD